MIEIIVMNSVGLLLIILGLLLWKKQMITLLHAYHYKNVKKEDYAPYTKKMGQAMMLMGLGIVATFWINYLSKSGYGWLIFLLCLVVSLCLMNQAQKSIMAHGLAKNS